MKFKKSLTILSLSLFAAAGLAFTVSASKDAKEVRADSANVYFNIAKFGPTYEDDNVIKNTEFSVYAFKDDGNEWLTVSKMMGYPNVLVVSADTSYTGFVVIRAAEGVKNTWPDQSADSWNQTSNLTRESSDTNYYHIGGTDTQYGKENYSIDIKTTKFSIRTGETTSDDTNMPFNFNSEEYEITGVELTSSQEFIIKHGDEKIGYDKLEDTDFNFGDAEDNYIHALYDGTYAFYLKSNGYIWSQVDPSLEAYAWAEGFVEGVGCSENYSEAPSNWGFYAGTFEDLSDGAKDILIAVEASNKEGATFIERAAFMHDICVSKYSLDVFMKRDGGGSRAINIPYNNNVINFNTTALIITIVSVVTVTSLLALVVFKKNKRK